MPKLTVVLPTYNEIENLELMVEALFGLGIPDLHILVVDDNSPDGTGAMAEKLAAKHAGSMGVLHNPAKGGLGPAYVLGFQRALAEGADYILQMDTDFSHQPKYVPDLIARLEQGADVVHGSRYVKGGGVDENWGWYRKLLSWFANRIYVRVLLGLPVNDATGGFRLWKRAALMGLGLQRAHSNGYVFQVEIAYLAYKLGFKLAEVPIFFPDRVRGTSKMDTNIASEAALRVFDILRTHRSLTPADRVTE